MTNTQYYVAGGTIDYVEGDVHTPVTGSDANDGLGPTTPKATVTALLAAYALGSGDIVNLAGTFVEAASESCSGAVFREWPNATPRFVWRGLRVPSGSWALHFGVTWKISIGAGKNVGAVVDRWSSRVFNTVRHGGYMTKMGVPAVGANISTAGAAITAVSIATPTVLTSAGHGLAVGSRITISGLSTTPQINGTYNVSAVPTVDTFRIRQTNSSAEFATSAVADDVGTWVPHSVGLYAYDSASGDLYVRLSDDSDPNALSGDNAVMWADASLTVGLSIVGNNNVVSGGTWRGFLNHAYADTGVGSLAYSIYIEGLGNRVTGGDFYDNEVHAITAASTASTSDCVIDNCRFYGMGITDAASQLVWFNNSGNVAGARRQGCVFHNYSLLNSAGNPLDANININGVNTHTDGAGGHVVSDLEGVDETHTFYSSPGTACVMANTAALSGAANLFASYPVRHTNIVIINGGAHGITGNMAWRRCTMPMLGTYAANQWLFDAGYSALFDACVLPINLAPAAAEGRQAIRLVAGSQLTLINTDVIILAAGTNFRLVFNISGAHQNAAFVLGSAGWKLNIHGCNIGFNAADGTGGVDNLMLIFEDTAPAGNYNFTGNNYFNVDASTGFSSNASFDSLAEFTNTSTGRDTSGKNVDPGYLDATSTTHGTAGYLAPTSLLKTNRVPTAVHTSLGINRRNWNRLIGAWQDGGGKARVVRALRYLRTAR